MQPLSCYYAAAYTGGEGNIINVHTHTRAAKCSVVGIDTNNFHAQICCLLVTNWKGINSRVQCTQNDSTNVQKNQQFYVPTCAKNINCARHSYNTAQECFLPMHIMPVIYVASKDFNTTVQYNRFNIVQT